MLTQLRIGDKRILCQTSDVQGVFEPSTDLLVCPGSPRHVVACDYRNSQLITLIDIEDRYEQDDGRQCVHVQDSDGDGYGVFVDDLREGISPDDLSGTSLRNNKPYEIALVTFEGETHLIIDISAYCGYLSSKLSVGVE